MTFQVVCFGGKAHSERPVFECCYGRDNIGIFCERYAYVIARLFYFLPRFSCFYSILDSFVCFFLFLLFFVKKTAFRRLILIFIGKDSFLLFFVILC